MFLERRMGNMTNLILFINAFLSYLLCFVFIIALVIIACVIGVKWRKSKDAKAALQSEETENVPNGNASA
jgi:predicted membrane protein